MKNENALTIPRQTTANGIACVFWWAITGLIGIPLAMAGLVLGVPKLQGLWGAMANKCLKTFHTVSVSPLTQTIVVDFLQHPLDEKNLLNIAHRNDGHYLRFVRHVGEGGIVSRIDLSMIIRGELAALGLEDSLPSALSYTLRQMEAGVFMTWVKQSPRGHFPSASPASTGSSIPAGEPSALKPTVVAVENGGTGREKKPLEQSLAPSEPVSKVVSEKLKKMADLRHTHAITGVVIFSGIKQFDEVGGKSYSSFVACIKCADGSEAEFSGVELEKEFSANGYAQGDRLTIRKLPSKLIYVTVGDQKVKRQRNSFEITRA